MVTAMGGQKIMFVLDETYKDRERGNTFHSRRTKKLCRYIKYHSRKFLLYINASGENLTLALSSTFYEAPRVTVTRYPLKAHEYTKDVPTIYYSDGDVVSKLPGSRLVHKRTPVTANCCKYKK